MNWTVLIFKPLKNVEYFRQFVVRYNTLDWQNGADFAPVFLRDTLAQQNLEPGAKNSSG